MRSTMAAMTPVGHAAVALLAGRPGRLPPTALVIGGVLPDADWLLFWAPSFNAWHRVATHNLTFVLVASALAALALRRWMGLGWTRAFAAVAIGALAHVVVDACMDTNPSNGIGVALGWPFTDAMWSPFNVMRFEDNPAGWAAPGRAAAGVVRGLPWELPVVAVAAWFWWRERGDTSPAPPG